MRMACRHFADIPDLEMGGSRQRIEASHCPVEPPATAQIEHCSLWCCHDQAVQPLNLVLQQ